MGSSGGRITNDLLGNMTPGGRFGIGGGATRGLPGMGNAPRPPELHSPLNTAGGLKEGFKIGGYNYGQSDVDALRARATATGPSSWLGLQNQKIDTEAAGLRDKTVQDAGTMQGQAFSQLAASGGLESGSRERLASAGALNTANSLQGVGRNTQMAKLSAGLADEQQKLDLMTMLPGLQAQQGSMLSGDHRFNVGTRMTAHGLDADSRLRGYEAEMTARGADATARAMAKPQPGFIRSFFS